MANNGTGVFTFALSSAVGTGKPLSLSGLAKSGDKPEFIFVFNGKEYKEADGTAAVTGVTAGTKLSGATNFVLTPISINALNKNSYITVP